MSCPFFSKTKDSIWNSIKKLVEIKSKKASNLQAKLDTTIDAIITINEKKEIEAFNKAAERIFGYEKEDVLGKNVNMLMPEPFYGQHDEYVNHFLLTGEKKIIGIGREVLARRKDGSIFPIDLAVTEMHIGPRRMFTGIIRDITQKKEAEELKQQNIRMEAEAKAKSEYISILSHELRTPLTAIQGALGLLLHENLQNKPKELLSIAYRNTERLGNIIKVVLDIEKFQEGKLKIDSKIISIVPLIKEAIATSQFTAQKKNITLVDTVPLDDVCVLTDYNRLFQVCLNLLSNAIKFSYFGGKVTIALYSNEEKIIVHVIDEGCGIPASFQTKIFTPFSQAIQGDTKAEGVGLGLHICKKIIDLFGGKIGFTSKEGAGSDFYFELPIYKEKVFNE